MAKECWLTTKDNPYDPFEEPEQWRRYDSVDNDYCTGSYIARIALLSDSMTEAEEAVEIERAVNEIPVVKRIVGIYSITYSTVHILTARRSCSISIAQ